MCPSWGRGDVDRRTGATENAAFAIHRIDVESAQEMYEAAQTCFPTSDVGILCAAVADFRPETVAGKKIKREKEEKLTLHLQATQDIAASLERSKKTINC